MTSSDDSRSSNGTPDLLSRFARLSRRDFMRRSLAVGAGVPLAASILAACGSSSASTSSKSASASASSSTSSSSGAAASPATSSAAATTSQTAASSGNAASPAAASTMVAVAGRAGGNVTFLTSVPATSLDPTQWHNEDIWPFSSIYEGLTSVAKDGVSLEPNLADKWDISTDGLTYTFHLLPGVLFSDGTKMTSEDVVWTLQRAQTAKASPWTFVLSAVKTISAPDPATVVVTLKEVWAPFISDISLFSCYVISKAFGEKVGDTGIASQAMGTGPFALKDWQKGDHVTLAKNQHYRVKGLPYLDTITFKIVPDSNSQILQVQGGQADGVIGQSDVPFNRVQEFKNNSKLQVLSFKSTYVNYVTFNTKHKPLDDVKFRQALCYATNVPALIKTILFGNGQVANSFFPTGMLYWNPDQKPYPFDLTKAKQLLSQSTSPSGAKFSLMVQSGNAAQLQLATELKSMWSEIGVDVSIQQVGTAIFRQTEVKGNFDAAPSAWTNDIIDPDELVSWMILPASSDDSYTGWQDPNAIKLAHQAETTLDTNQRRQLYYQIQAIHQEAAPMVYLYMIPFINLVSAKVQGFFQSPMGPWDFTQTYLKS